MIKPVQCKMARAAVGWSVRDLAREARVNPSTVVRFENGQAEPIRLTVEAIQRALEAAGIEFTNGDAPGVRLRTPSAA
jgi:transcriptional regulator with XRE-family HTH domain